jgi:hypothetical protein
MSLGVYLRELCGHKLGLAVCAVIAVLATAQIVDGVSLFPPGIGSNSLNVASASTRVIVDTPKSAAVDPLTDAYTIESLSNRALILGNVMASLPVRQYIAARAGITAAQLRVEPPLTPEQPRAMVDSAHAPHVSDILKRPDEYRLSIEANPMAPVLDLYAMAPTSGGATKLADASVDGLRDYLVSVASSRRTPMSDRVRLEQLGRAEGGSIDAGSTLQIGILTFVLSFALSCLGLLFAVRVRRGWDAAGRAGVSSPGGAG